MIINNDERMALMRIGRLFADFVFIFLFIFGVHSIAKIYGPSTFAENGVIENIQLGLLILSCVSFSVQAKFHKSFRTVLLLLASCLLLAACRELDEVLDEIVPVVHWKFAFLFPLGAIWYAFCHLKETRKSLVQFFNFPAFYFMYLAVLVIIPLGQCIGHGPFVKSVFGEGGHVAAIKEFYEESAEVVGYFMVLLSSFEMHFNLKK